MFLQVALLSDWILSCDVIGGASATKVRFDVSVCGDVAGWAGLLGDDVNKRPNCSAPARQCVLRAGRRDKDRPKRSSDPRRSRDQTAD